MRYKYYKQVIDLFLENPIPLVLVRKIYSGESFEGQDYIGLNLKLKFREWATIWSIIETAQNMYKDALQNGNIKSIR